LGVLLVENEENYTGAEQNFLKALNINRKLYKSQPEVNSLYLSGTLSNLGTLYRIKKKFDKAEDYYVEALGLTRQLSNTNPSIYLPKVAQILNNLGNLYQDKKDFERAEQAYQECLLIRQSFVKLLPNAHSPDLAQIMMNMSVFYIQSYSKKEKSVKFATEVIKIAEQFQHIPIVMKYKKTATQILQQWNVDVESLFQKNKNL